MHSLELALDMLHPTGHRLFIPKTKRHPLSLSTQKIFTAKRTIEEKVCTGVGGVSAVVGGWGLTWASNDIGALESVCDGCRSANARRAAQKF